MTTTELRALLAQATPGPWFDAGGGHVGGTECVRGRDGWPEPYPIPVADSTEDDAALIAAAVNALPRLLDVVEAAEIVADSVFHTEQDPGAVISLYRREFDVLVAAVAKWREG
jgi:hypothetical protein